MKDKNISFWIFVNWITFSRKLFLHKCHLGCLAKFRYSHERCSFKKGVFRNFTKFKGKHLCQNLFFTKVADLRPAPLDDCFLRLKSIQNILSSYFKFWCSIKKVFLLNLRENTSARVSFLIKLHLWGLQLYYKKDSDTVVFLWVFPNF